MLIKVSKTYIPFQVISLATLRARIPETNGGDNAKPEITIKQ